MRIAFYGGPFDGEEVTSLDGVVITLHEPANGHWHQYKLTVAEDNGMTATYVRALS